MSNLPNVPTSLVGREPDMEVAVAMLARDHVRLLTVVGPGGMGKTRLALELARLLQGDFPDGVHFVDLAPLEEPEQMLGAVAAVLGVEETGSVSLLEALKHYASTHCALIVLDNFEHIVGAASAVGELVAAAGQTKFVVTSRVPLQLSWERRLPLHGLSLPDAGAPIEQSAAVALFVQRARALLPDFALTEANTPAVAGVCRVLDGMPLAIELAAAQMDVRSPQAVLDGLKTEGLDLLSTGTRDLPDRHQTLRATIGWSERLLEPAEREVFRSLAVFSGGFTVDAAAYVAGDSARKALVGLVRKNLLRFESEVGRYVMLEMVREYALEHPSTEELEPGHRLRHLEWCLGLAEAAEPELRHAQQKRWMDVLEREHANLLSALAWCRRTNRVEEGLRLVAGIGWFWLVRAHLFEAEGWFTTFLNASTGRTTASRMRALVYGAWLSHQMGRREQRLAFATEALAIAETRGNKSYESWALQLIARTYLLSELGRARSLAERALQAAKDADDETCLRYTEHFLAQVCVRENKPAEALAHANSAEAMHRQSGDLYYLLWTVGILGSLALAAGDFGAAKVRYREALYIAYDLPSSTGLESAFLQLSLLAANEGDHQRAARLIGIRERLRESTGSGLGGPTFNINTNLGKALADARANLGDEGLAFQEALGRAMSLEDAVAYATATSPVVSVGTVTSVLTTREAEVAGLVAQGLTDPQIAVRLVISPRTAERHVANILGKLGLATRTQIATWTMEHP